MRRLCVMVMAATLLHGYAWAETDGELRAIWQQGNLQRMEEIAETGDVRAEAWMGLMLQNRGYREESKVWWRKAADKGNLWAIGTLGDMLLVERQDEEAARWFLRGAEIGGVSSQETYASLLLAGRGVAKNEAEAARWLSAAAAQQSKYAYLQLAELYAEGRGVKRDPIEAYALAAIAEAVLDDSFFEPDRRAGELKTRLEKHLSPEDVKAALDRAKARRPDLGDIAEAKGRRDSSNQRFLLLILGATIVASGAIIAVLAAVGFVIWRTIRAMFGSRPQ